MPNVSLASSINQTSTACLADTDAPLQLGVALAKFGDVMRRPNPTSTGWVRAVDPLVLMLTNVEPGCRLEVLNLSKNPEAEWSDAGEIRSVPGSTAKALGDGRYGILMGNDAAKKMGVDPGDVFEIRQVDAAGNASEPSRIKLEQRTTVDANNLGSAYGQVDMIETPNLPTAGRVQIRPYADAHGPTVLTKNVSISADSADKGVIRGKKAIEPGATVFVHNEATNKTFSVVVGEDRKFELPFEAKIGHPLHLWVNDHNGTRTDLGLTNFAPACAKAGVCNTASLLAQV